MAFKTLDLRVNNSISAPFRRSFARQSTSFGRCRAHTGSVVTAIVIASSASLLTTHYAAANDSGLDDLIKRVGKGNQPTGAGVVVGQVESSQQSEGNYMPDADHPQLALEGRLFIPFSGDSDISSHATFVARNFFGTHGVAPGILTIYNWDVNDWLNDSYLRLDAGPLVPPDIPPDDLKIFNHSWVGGFIGDALNIEAVRRADYAATRDDLIMANGQTQPPIEGLPALMGPMFNGITVGRADGGHTTGDVPEPYDGAGRMKPDIVADATATSYSTAKVAGAAALLVETARNMPQSRSEADRRNGRRVRNERGSGTNEDPQRSEVIKAVLLAGAMRNDAWTNNPQTDGVDRGVTTRPLDETFGAGVLDVNIAHRLLTADQQDASPTPPADDNITHEGWDLVALESSDDAYYRFTVKDIADVVSIVATWQRVVTDDFLSWVLPDFDLELLREANGGALAPMTGNLGDGVWESGNVVSRSRVDNVELLQVEGLRPGSYIIKLSRNDLLVDPQSWEAAIAWRFPLGPPPCPGDANGDDLVNVADLLEVINNWGDDGSAGGDINDDNIVNVADLLEVINNWGGGC